MQVQNKLQLAQPRLPQVVQQQGIRVAKATKNFLVVLGFVSNDGRLNTADLSDFIASTVQDPLSRTNGVGDYQLFGSEYAMRIWLDPAKLNNYGMTPGDVAVAIQSQNVQVAAGELGGLPAVANQQLNATIIGPSYLQKPEEFSKILLRTQPNGARVLLRDVGRVELGAELYSISSKYNGKPASAIAIKLASGANALDTVKNVRATVESLRPNFPPGVEVIYPFDTTPFVELSIEEVVKTLGEAIVLVFLIMYLFLQNLRATLIPTIAVPVVLLGTCTVLHLAGYSINSLTMFGMVLAIGLLVDDAIVVVENVERVMEEEDLSPKEATRKSMDEISGALVGIALVLTAVFLPMSFFGGSVGVIYRQFSITIVTSMILSVIVALIFTPALCATILRRPKQGGRKGFFGWFNRKFDTMNRRYIGGVRKIIGHRVLSFLVFGGIVAVLAIVFLRVPGGFLPDEDQGVLFVQATAPPGATAKPDAGGAGRRGRVFPSGGRQQRRRRVRSDRVQLRRPGPELRPGVREAQGLERAARRGQQGPGDRGPCAEAFRRHQGRHGVRLRAPGRARVGQRHRLRLRTAGPRQQGARRADGRAQPAARRGVAG